jgi:hypothetical protein
MIAWWEMVLLAAGIPAVLFVVWVIRAIRGINRTMDHVLKFVTFEPKTVDQVVTDAYAGREDDHEYFDVYRALLHLETEGWVERGPKAGDQSTWMRARLGSRSNRGGALRWPGKVQAA